MMTATETMLAELAQRCLEAARRNGADSADVILRRMDSTSARCRQQKLEHSEQATHQDLSLRVLCGKRQAGMSCADFNIDLDELSARAVALARVATEDPLLGLADPEQLYNGPTEDFDNYEEVNADPQFLASLALETKHYALDNKAITNSEGAEASAGSACVHLAATNGFASSYKSSMYGLSAAVIAGTDDGMEVEWDSHRATRRKLLKSASIVGAKAAERAAARVGATKPSSGKFPLIFEARVARSLLSCLASAVNGRSHVKRTSFLTESLGKKIFADTINVIDDPHMRFGLGSRAFDDEGVATRRTDIIRNGVFTERLMDLASARALAYESQGPEKGRHESRGRASEGRARQEHASQGRARGGHARRSGSALAPASSNFYLQKGSLELSALIADIEDGFLITSLMGMGVDLASGNYSQGAGGFRIRSGRLAEPVKELTIASSLQDMFLTLEAGSDLEFDSRVSAPSIRIESMTVSGR